LNVISYIHFMKFGSFQQFRQGVYFGIIKKFLAYRPAARQQKGMYLTFDDGPEPGITEFVLDQLAAHRAKATFFCCGHNIDAHRSLYDRILNEGHAVGNHTYSHLDGLQTAPRGYVADVMRCDQAMSHPVLFRPPWGMMNFRELLALRQKRIVLWDVESGDVRPDYILSDSIRAIDSHLADNNCIVLFHFSKEHEERTRVLLPAILSHYSEQGYAFWPLYS
jgi:peptidoglycan/xylan/chitin deacetylase (PgdA/CDA1 family)